MCLTGTPPCCVFRGDWSPDRWLTAERGQGSLVDTVCRYQRSPADGGGAWFASVGARVASSGYRLQVAAAHSPHHLGPKPSGYPDDRRCQQRAPQGVVRAAHVRRDIRGQPRASPPLIRGRSSARPKGAAKKHHLRLRPSLESLAGASA